MQVTNFKIKVIVDWEWFEAQINLEKGDEQCTGMHQQVQYILFAAVSNNHIHAETKNV